MAVKQAEVLADMAAHGQYRISRAAYYQKLRAHSPEQADELHDLLSTGGNEPSTRESIAK
jgi:hypothetical protein